MSLAAARTTAALVLLLSGLWLVLIIAGPLTAWKRGMVAAMFGTFLLVLAIPPLRDLFGVVLPRPLIWLAALGIVALVVAALELGWGSRRPVLCTRSGASVTVTRKRRALRPHGFRR
jgi:cation-transporting ATPase E